jgi:heat shock protein HtpX
MTTSNPVTHDDLIAKNRRTSVIMLVSEFVLIGLLGAGIGFLVTRSAAGGIIVGAAVAVAIDVVAWLFAVRATIALTHAVEVTHEQAPVLHNVIEGLCIATGLPKPKVYIVDDPAPNAFAFGRSPQRSGVAVTSGILNLMSRRELEGVLAHELSHVRNRDVQVTTLAVTTVGLLVVVADISARAGFFSDLGDRRGNDDGALLLFAVAAVAGVLAFGARLLSLAISRHREELADTSAAAIVSPDGLRRALEKLEADHTVLHHVSRATAHLWLVAPLHLEGDERHARTNRLFDTHPPLAQRIAILRQLEGLDPNGRGPVDETATGVPVDLAKLTASTDRRMSPGSSVGVSALAATTTTAVPAGATDPTGHPPGWYHADERTLRYWDGTNWTDWQANWNGRRWVQRRPT